MNISLLLLKCCFNSFAGNQIKIIFLFQKQLVVIREKTTFENFLNNEKIFIFRCSI